MVEVPGGEFQMGCSPGDTACVDIEKPAHRVVVRPFRIGRYELTQAQWRSVMSVNSPSAFKDDDRPVEMVSWDDAQEFLERLNARNPGKPYRLPTEAEWEYAARAGSKTAYWWGATIGTGRANCWGCGSQWDSKETAPVGSFPPNAFGLHDTIGNVWEWVQDCWHHDYKQAPTDGSEWRVSCFSTNRALRGGSWSAYSPIAHVSNRHGGAPGHRGDDLGFRLAQDL
jgi:formylglycine-generating enzyme required for sulfatase activity